MEPQLLRGDQINAQLGNLVAKIKLQSSDFSDLNCRVCPTQTTGISYLIEISKGRFVRRVNVDGRTIQHRQSGQSSENLSRELRSAMLAVARRANDRK